MWHKVIVNNIVASEDKALNIEFSGLNDRFIFFLKKKKPQHLWNGSVGDCVGMECHFLWSCFG